MYTAPMFTILDALPISHLRYCYLKSHKSGWKMKAITVVVVIVMLGIAYLTGLEMLGIGLVPHRANVARGLPPVAVEVVPYRNSVIRTRIGVSPGAGREAAQR